MVITRTSLTAAEHERVLAAVTAAQKKTHAKFNVMVVPCSNQYNLFPVVWAAVFSLLITSALAIMHPELGIREGIFTNAALFIALAALFDWLPLRLLLVPPSIKRNYARHFAHREFAINVVADSQQRNGVLLFVSLGERYIEILADREIHNRVAKGTWDNITSDFVAAVRAGKLADGFINAIEACGTALAEHYPG